MEWALYHPAYGYYAGGPNIGPRGDFTTSPEASPSFGRLLANHVADVDALLGHHPQFTVVECGPGRGTLAADLLEALATERRELYERTHYYLVEISSALAREQQSRLLPEHGSLVQWASSLDELPAGLSGALVANEVVDAFPVHVLENRGGGLVEHYVDMDESGQLIIAYGWPSQPELVAVVDKYCIALKPGERIEINLAANEWVRQVERVLGRGVAAIIDYGDTSPGRYSDARREGTLLGYYSGAVTDNVLAHPGEQDLTALVDFTALQDAARDAGLTVLGLTRQANFLLGLGLGTSVIVGDEDVDLGAAIARRTSMHSLVSPEGLGRFRVLLLGKGIDADAARAGLSGLKYAGIGE
jgi:SAM-dependent MidA family methyltransferase